MPDLEVELAVGKNAGEGLWWPLGCNQSSTRRGASLARKKVTEPARITLLDGTSVTCGWSSRGSTTCRLERAADATSVSSIGAGGGMGSAKTVIATAIRERAGAVPLETRRVFRSAP